MVCLFSFLHVWGFNSEGGVLLEATVDGSLEWDDIFWDKVYGVRLRRGDRDGLC